jgi:peptide deformylase
VKVSATIQLFLIGLCLCFSSTSFAAGELTSSERMRLERRIKVGDLSVLSVESGSQKRLLEKPSRFIAPSSPDLQRLILHLEQTVRHQGGMGIAAVQIGIPVRLILVRRRDGEGGERFQAFLNPKIIGRSSTRLASWENCLSVPWGYRFTYRPAQITLRFQAAKAKTQVEILKGEEAVVLQQEIDHLNGLLLSHGHSRSWFIPDAEIKRIASALWQECQTLSKTQCDQRMRASWQTRAIKSFQ